MSRANMAAASSEHSNVTSTSARIKRLPSTHSNGNGNSNSTTGNKQQQQKQHKRQCCSHHLNSVWSIWYCLVTLGFTGYLVFAGIKRFLMYASLPWPQGASVVVLPFFLVTSAVKVGNLGNDGFKLGASLSTCTRDPPPVLSVAPGIEFVATRGSYSAVPTPGGRLLLTAAGPSWTPRSSLLGSYL
ncbi:tincar-like, partial [Homarus americanus]